MIRIIWVNILLIVVLGISCPDLSRAENEAKPSPIPETKAVKSKPTAATLDENYPIGPGDILEISVWKDEVLNKQPVVRPDGFISFPLVGDIRAAGKTTAQLKMELEKRLVSYVPDVILSLDVKQINSMIIFVIGRVNTPGRFNINSNINVLQALATAGGLNVFAKRSKIKIFREEDGKTMVFPFDYDDVVDGKRMDMNIRLKRGDIVVIP